MFGLKFICLLAAGSIILHTTAMETVNQDVDQRAKNQSSICAITPSTLPEKYSLESIRIYTRYPDLTVVKDKYPIEASIQKEWDTASLLAMNCCIIHGVDFLEFEPQKVISEYSTTFKFDTAAISNEKAYFNTFWARQSMSASLVGADALYVAGKYGLILDVPSPLILRTYTVDAVTSSLKQADNDHEINEFLDKYIINGFAGNQPHTYDKQSDMPIVPANELIEITMKNQRYNEVYLAPCGKVHGTNYNMRIIGIYVNDEAMKIEFSIPSWWPTGMPFAGQPKYSNQQKLEMLNNISAELNLPIIRKSNYRKDIKHLQTIYNVNDGK